MLVKPVGQPPFTSRLRFGMSLHLVDVKHAIDGPKAVTLDFNADVLERNAALWKKT